MSDEYIVMGVLLFILWSILMCKTGWDGRRSEVEALKTDNETIAGELIATIGFLGIEQASVQSLKMEVDQLKYLLFSTGGK